MGNIQVSLELKHKQRKVEKQIKEELKNPDFYSMYTRKTLREVMIALFPYETMMNDEGKAFSGMTKKRMCRHLKGYAILKQW